MDLELRDPIHRVSPRTPLIWAASGVVRVAIVVVALLLMSGPWHWFTVPTWGWIVLALVALVYLVAMPLIRYRVHRWETTDTAVYTQTGWLTRERRIAPMARVQTVDVGQGPVARLCGVATLVVTTASAAGPLRIEGLDRRLAERLAEELTRRTAAETGDAT